jgi:hypothetical protein
MAHIIDTNPKSTVIDVQIRLGMLYANTAANIAKPQGINASISFLLFVKAFCQLFQKQFLYQIIEE